MKSQKSSANDEVTPSKKVLKQARLPFQILSETSPKTDAISTRKRKLSAPEQEPVNKVGKITKKNEGIDPVVISDDDSKDYQKESVPEEKDVKTMNPFVKLVDTAWKKKQKSKTVKKKKSKKNVQDVNSSPDHVCEEIENRIDIGEVLETDHNTDKIQNLFNNQDIEKPNDIIMLEDSNDVTEVTNIKKKNTNNDKEILVVSDNEELVNSQKDYDTAKNNSKASSPVTPTRTPKRKVESGRKSLNMSQSIEDSESNQNTPKRITRSSSVVKSEGDVSLTESSNAILTPKQLQRKQEYAKKREEREKKKQQEKEEKEKIKQEKEAQRRKEKEEKEEQKRKEKEEKEKQKELEKKLKEEKEEQKRKEREEKEEQKRKEKEARDEEKKKKQEALELEKQEQEQKKKKAAEAFASFFVPKQKVEKDQATVGLSKNEMLSNFTIKADMRLAPAVRNSLTEERKKALDQFLECQVDDNLYIKNLRNGYKPFVGQKTWPLSDKDDDIVIVEDELPLIDGAEEILSCDSGVREKLRPKLLSFHDNRRPPYWGTWRKRSAFIKPRKPFSMDQKQLEYEVDSDEEWEEEEGESIDGSAGGSDDEGPDEYELDNEVFVPHGYLSDEEATMDDDDVMSLSPETQKARLKHLEDEFESELKKPTEKLKPRLYGLLWETADGKPEKCVDVLWNYFSKLSMIMNDPTLLMQPSVTVSEVAEKKKVKKKKNFIDCEKSPAEKKKKEKKEIKDSKKNEKQEKNQLGINAFLSKVKN